MLEEDTLEPDHEVSANNHPCVGANNTMEQIVDPFLLVPQQTEAHVGQKRFIDRVFF